jgi:hypothetical protein
MVNAHRSVRSWAHWACSDGSLARRRFGGSIRFTASLVARLSNFLYLVYEFRRGFVQVILYIVCRLYSLGF